MKVRISQSVNGSEPTEKDLIAAAHMNFWITFRPLARAMARPAGRWDWEDKDKIFDEILVVCA